MGNLEETLNRMKQTLCDGQLSREQDQKDLNGDTCPICHGEEWVYERDEYGVEYAAPCKCRERKVMDRRLRFAELPDSLKTIRLNTFNLRRYTRDESREIAAVACRGVKFYLENLDAMLEKGMGLYLWSEEKGSGKTRMAASIANALMLEHGIQVKFATSLNILQEIKSTWGQNGNKQQEGYLLDALQTVKVLVIDDFGTEEAKDWIREKFYQILNERYLNKLPTILTSNFPLDGLNYDRRITNRLQENTFQIHFPEESVRETIAKENADYMLSNVVG